MKQSFKDISTNFICNKIITEDLDGRKLLPYLLSKHVITRSEHDTILVKDSTNSLRYLITDVMKNKKDGNMLDFLEALNDAGYTDAYEWLKKQIDDFDKADPTRQGSFKIPLDMSDSYIEVIRKSIKEHYREDLESIEIYWNKFGVCGKLDMEIFYNQNIEIKDELGKMDRVVHNFSDLFNSNYKRIIIFAEAGYGKSTFVHEMARQWVKGEEQWTKKFWFLFLFRLGEMDEDETLQTLLMKLVGKNDSLTLNQWLGESNNLQKCLFIFDGLDEMQQRNKCKEIDDLLFGKGAKQASVVITSRPGNQLEKLRKMAPRYLCIELTGLSNNGVKEQLRKFDISPVKIITDKRSVLNVPLFNTLFCITNSTSTIGCLSVCTTIERFVTFACERFRIVNEKFTEKEEQQLILTLGQAAQNKYNFISESNTEYPYITEQLLLNAIGTGLLYQKSNEEDLIFPHQTIAEYCAAYFWYRTIKLDLSRAEYHNLFSDRICFSEGNIWCRINSLLSCFLSHFNRRYKVEVLWKKFKYNIPWLDEYLTLPNRSPPSTEKSVTLAFMNHSLADQANILDKIDFSSYTNLHYDVCLHQAHFYKCMPFISISKLYCLNLTQCYFKIDPEEFFYHYKVRKLTLTNCTFNNFIDNTIEVNYFENWRPILESLEIHWCDLTVLPFLEFILTHCTTLKTLIVKRSFKNPTSIDSIDRLQEKSTVDLRKLTIIEFPRASFSSIQKKHGAGAISEMNQLHQPASRFQSLKVISDKMICYKVPPVGSKIDRYKTTNLSPQANIFASSEVEIKHHKSISAETTPSILSDEVRMNSESFDVQELRNISDSSHNWLMEAFAGYNGLYNMIENIYFELDDPFDLSPFLFALRASNLLKFTLKVTSRPLTKSETFALNILLMEGVKRIKDLELNYASEISNNAETISSLCHLDHLKILNIEKLSFPAYSVPALGEIFSSLKLEKCTINYQESFMNDIFLSSIKSCVTLTDISLMVIIGKDKKFHHFVEYMQSIGFSFTTQTCRINNQLRYSFQKTRWIFYMKLNCTNAEACDISLVSFKSKFSGDSIYINFSKE